jgi:endonuclease/exonuclease/phosphatase family metal-dependent hydrolase
MSAPPPGRASMGIKILTLNVWNTEGPAERQETLRSEIQALDADLICLQEVVRRPDYDQLRFLLGDTGLHLVHDTDLINGTTWGSAIATRWKPTSVAARRLAGADSGPTAIAAVVPLPIGEAMLFLGVKPSYKFTDEAARCRQAVEIAALEEEFRQAAPTVIAGDFDAEPDNECMRFYTGRAPLDGRSAHFRDSWALAGDGGPGHTWTTDNAWVAGAAASGWIQIPHRRRIDYILAGSPENHPDVLSRITSCRIVLDSDPAPSDHYGVIADLELSPHRPHSTDGA